MEPKFRAKREAAGLTRDQAAQKLGVVTETLRRWEKHETSPTVDALLAMAKVYQCSVYELIGI